MIVTSDFRQVAQRNVDLLNEMLTELVPDQVPFTTIARVISVILIFMCSRQEHPEDRKLLEELGSSCKEIQVTQNLCQLANIFVKAAGWQKLHGSTGDTRRKVWTRTKILSPNIRYFVAN